MLFRFMYFLIGALSLSTTTFAQSSPGTSLSQTDSIIHKVIINSTPTGAEVFIKDSLYGITPFELKLPPGEYLLAFRKAGFEDTEKLITIIDGKTQIIIDELSAIPEIIIHTIPKGADVYIDSAFAGRTPIDSFYTQRGKHEVKISREGYEDIVTDINVVPGKNIYKSLSLKPKFGFLSLKVSPEDAQVFIEGTKITGSFSKLKLNSGQYDLKVMHHSVKNSFTKRITIFPGVALELNAPLDRFSVTAGLYSALVPGTGQIFDGSYIKGGIEFLISAGAGYLLYSAVEKRNDMDLEFNRAAYQYKTASTEPAAVAARERLSAAAVKLREARNKVTMTLAGFGAAYVVTLIDALIFHSTERHITIEKTTAIPLKDLESYSDQNYNIKMKFPF